MKNPDLKKENGTEPQENTKKVLPILDRAELDRRLEKMSRSLIYRAKQAVKRKLLNRGKSFDKVRPEIFISCYLVAPPYRKVSTINDIVNKIKALGYDAMLDKQKGLTEDDRGRFVPSSLVFKFKAKGAEEYHVAASDDRKDYEDALSFLEGKKTGDIERIKRMLGLEEAPSGDTADGMDEKKQDKE
ncbi:MAG: hypothetical protein LBQ97_01125 [Fusobacteriaceae bacterium]|jgi:hypothetical protein|nr:hypothetical protein [Fusobacteriaceae bacterium]